MAAISSLPGMTFFPFGCGSGNTSSPPPTAGDSYPERTTNCSRKSRKLFSFFLEQADPTTGQVKDRALAAGNRHTRVSSIAATGFGLTTLCIGDQRGYQPSAAIAAACKATLNFVVEPIAAERDEWVLYHLWT